MPTDLACKPCKGTGWHPDRIARAGDPYTDPCPDCAGSGVAAWAVEVGAQAHTKSEGFISPGHVAMRAALAAVREEAKKQ